MQIPFFRPHITEAEIQEVVDTLRSGWLTTGPRTKDFERAFAEYVGLPHAVALNSCTAALHLALEAIGLKENDGVLVPAMTFAATAEVVRYFKAVPVLVDCREADLNMDPEDAPRRLQSAQAKGMQVRAIIPMHYGGQIGEVSALIRLAKDHSLAIIEDAAHCLPGKYRDHEQDVWRSVGSFSDISCFSFYANKCITTGEGGMACTSKPEYADRMRIMSLHGISRDAWKRFTAEGSWYYEILAPGFKYNLTDVAAALGLHQLRRADWLHRQRTRVAQRYTELLTGIEAICLPRELPNRRHSWHLYPIRLARGCGVDRAQFIAELNRQGIGTSVHWMPLHMHPYYRQTYGYSREDFPVAATLYDELVSLPIFPDLQDPEIEYVTATIRRLVEALASRGSK